MGNPDLRVILTIFVRLGVLFSSLSQDLLNNPANIITKTTTKLDSSKLDLSTAVRTLVQGRFVNVPANVSTIVTSPDKDAKQQHAFNELPPTEYFPQY